MSNENNKINTNFLKNVKSILMREHDFISNLLSILPIPASANRDDLVDEETGTVEEHVREEQTNEEKPRAKTLTELRARLKAIQKKKLMYKDRLLKKKLKNQIKKKTKREEILAQKKLARIAKLNKSAAANQTTHTVETQISKPVFNKESKMVFSKIEFSNIGKKPNKKLPKDPKRILKNIETEKTTLNELEAKGEAQKVKEIKEKTAWKNALARAEGVKVKDDPHLLKVTIKRNEQTKRTSKKKWQDRQEAVRKAQETRVTKRNENIAKRNKEKKTKKIKKAVKRGRIIPGH